MPKRKEALKPGLFYHIFNRGVAKMPTFTSRREFSRAIGLIDYYRFAQTPLKYSELLTKPPEVQANIFKYVYTTCEKRVSIHAFVLMDNHFHFLLKQHTEQGISEFIADFTNSYTRYVNISTNRVGHLFQGKFKSVYIETPEQLAHLGRYIHLNPYSGHLVETPQELCIYPYSSFPDYIGHKIHNFVEKSVLSENYKNNESYRRFVLSQRDYQRKISLIKKLVLEKVS